MEIIDRYAYANRQRHLEPADKVTLALCVILICLLAGQPAVGLLAMVWMWFLTTFLAGLPGRLFLRLLVAQALFFCLAAAGIALSLSAAPPASGSWWQVGPYWIGSSSDALTHAALVVTRALGSAAAMNFLTLTTPLVDLVGLMQRLRVPPLLIDLTSLIYRFTFVLWDSARRIRTAQASRLGYHGYRRSMVSAGLLGSRLFADALQRSRRLNVALSSRGYEGQLRILLLSYQHHWPFLLWSIAVVGTLLAVGRLL